MSSPLGAISEQHFFAIAPRCLQRKPTGVTDREKALFDCVDRQDLDGGILQLAQALPVATGALDWSRLDAYLM